MLSHAARRAPLYGRRLVTLTAPRSTRLWFSACGVLGCHHVRHQIPLDRTRYGVFSQGCLSCLSAMPVALRPSLVVSAWKGEHSVILTLSVAAVDDAQTPDRRSRYTWHSAVPTSGCW